jgi:hypothetical protein
MNDPSDAFLVALDISGFSNEMDPDQLLGHRMSFFYAVEATRLFPEAKDQGTVRVHFLGDELRLAFLAVVGAREVKGFVDDVFAAVEFLEDLVAPSLARWEERRSAWSTPAIEAGIEREWRELIAPPLPQVEGRLRQDLLFDRIWERVLDERARRMLFRTTLLRRPWDWDVMTLLGEPEEDASTAEATAERLRKTSLLGQVEKAVAYLESSLTIAGEIKDPEMEAIALRNLERLRQRK